MEKVLKRVLKKVSYMFKAEEMEKKQENLQKQVELLQEENAALKKELSGNQELKKQASDLKYFVEDVLPKAFSFTSPERICMLCYKVLQKEPLDKKKEEQPVKLTVAK